MMGIEPVFLLADVPAEIAYAIGGAGGVAIGAMWRRLVFLEDRSRSDRIEALNAVHVGTTAIAAFVNEWHLWRDEWREWRREELARLARLGISARDENSA